jgi:hypothetical protein
MVRRRGHGSDRGLPLRRLDETHEAPTARKLPVTDAYLARVPRVALAPSELHASDLDHREYFLISMFDGHTTVDMLLDLAGIPGEETLALLDSLIRRGIIRLD